MSKDFFVITLSRVELDLLVSACACYLDVVINDLDSSSFDSLADLHSRLNYKLNPIVSSEVFDGR